MSSLRFLAPPLSFFPCRGAVNLSQIRERTTLGRARAQRNTSTGGGAHGMSLDQKRRAANDSGAAYSRGRSGSLAASSSTSVWGVLEDKNTWFEGKV